jgi:hypothetical protein
MDREDPPLAGHAALALGLIALALAVALVLAACGVVRYN